MLIGVTKGSFETQCLTNATAGLEAIASSEAVASSSTQTVMTKTMLPVTKRSKGATEEEAQKEVGGVTIRSSMMLIVTKLQLNSDFT
jgi:hypothetical protein